MAVMALYLKYSGLFLNSGFLGRLSMESRPQNAEFNRQTDLF